MQTSKTLLLGAGLTTALGAWVAWPALASNHREAPITALDHKADITDLYAFVSYDDTTLREGRHPTRHDLDRVSTRHPIWIYHMSFHYAAVNTPVQGSAADLIKMAMIAVDQRLQDEGLAAKMLLQVHDELVFECPDAELEQLKVLVREEMEGVYELSVPLHVDMGTGPDWASAH